MASSTLKLVIQKGPREGETLEFNPRSTIRIGRVARGNNVTIKDSGISSKHLLIEFNSDSGRWVIKDLDSSNGTFLNSSEIKPLSPFEISHGDDIKIGEVTAIRVEIVEIKDEISVRRSSRRRNGVSSGNDLSENVEFKDGIEKCKNTKKRGGCRNGDELAGEVEGGLKVVENVDSVDEIGKCRNPRNRGADKGNEVSELKENLDDPPRGRRGRAKKANNFNDVEIGNVKSECSVSTRRTRSSMRGDDELPPLPVRRTRGAKKAEVVMEKIVENAEVDAGECKEVESMKMAEDKPCRGRGRKKEGVECLEKVQEPMFKEEMNLEVSEKVDGEGLEKVQEVVLEEKMNLEVSEKVQEDVEEHMNPEVSETVQEDVEEHMNLEVSEKVLEDVEEHVNLEVSEKVQDDVEERTNLEVAETEDGECSERIQEAVEEHMNLEVLEKAGGECLQKLEEVVHEELMNLEALEKDGGKCSVKVRDALEDKSSLEVSEKEDLEKDLELRQHSCGGTRKVLPMPDLENMTLGEWFDFLEVYLPNQIYAETDGIIEDMKNEAKMLNDFMLQQLQEKGNRSLVMDQTRS